MAHAFNPSIEKQRQADLSEMEARVAYRVSSRTVRKKQTNKQAKIQ